MLFGARAEGSQQVSDVNYGSPADNAGIHRGDVIMEVNKEKVYNLTGFEERVGKIEMDSNNVLFLIKRGGSSMYIAVKLQ